MAELRQLTAMEGSEAVRERKTVRERERDRQLTRRRRSVIGRTNRRNRRIGVISSSSTSRSGSGYLFGVVGGDGGVAEDWIDGWVRS